MSHKPTVLAADDSETALMYLCIAMSRMGFDVIPSENGNEAIKLARILKPELILLDLVMPEKGGIEALQEIRADPDLAAIPVIMVSVISEQEKIDRCRQLGCAGYLTKPIRLMELHRTIYDHLMIPRSKKRQHMRCDLSTKVLISHDGLSSEHFAENLSEGGIYLRAADGPETGAQVVVTLPLDGERELELNGVLLYRRRLYGDIFRRSPGMAIRFQDLEPETLSTLRDFISRQLAGDLIEEQEEELLVI